MKQNLINELREEILSRLKEVTQANSPYIHSRIQTQAGYAALEQEIIERVIRTGLTPAAIIPQMEMENDML